MLCACTSNPISFHLPIPKATQVGPAKLLEVRIISTTQSSTIALCLLCTTSTATDVLGQYMQDAFEPLDKPESSVLIRDCALECCNQPATLIGQGLTHKVACRATQKGT